MRLTTRTNLAARVLMHCAVNPGRIIRTSEIAGQCNASLNHIARVVQQLQIAGYLETTRGRGGGVLLAREPETVSIGAVFRLFETEIPFAECFDASANTCPLIDECRLKSYIERALDAFYHELDMVTLDDLVRGNCGLSELLTMQPVPRAACPPRAAL